MFIYSIHKNIEQEKLKSAFHFTFRLGNRNLGIRNEAEFFDLLICIQSLYWAIKTFSKKAIYKLKYKDYCFQEYKYKTKMGRKKWNL